MLGSSCISDTGSYLSTLLTVIGLFLGQILTQSQIDAMTITGGLMLVGIALRLLDIKKIAVANLLPALVIAPVIVAIIG